MAIWPVFVNIDWENKKNLVEQGKIDCIWACFSVTGRENDYHWAGPYMLSRQVIAVNDSSKINKLSDLKNKIIAVQSTTKPEELFLKQTDPKIPKVKQVYSMENRELIYTSLSRGYVDAIAAHEISIRQYMSDFEAKYRILDEDILETGIGVAFAKNDKRGIEKELSKVMDIEYCWLCDRCLDSSFCVRKNRNKQYQKQDSFDDGIHQGSIFHV